MTQPMATSVGRAKAVLVFGMGGARKAVVTTITARVRRRPNGCRLTYCGPVSFTPEVAKHHLEVVLAAVDAILRFLGVPRRAFEVSVANLGVASQADLAMTVSGYSADLPLFMAFASAALGICLPQDVIMTGHIASPYGDIRSVSSIQAKVKATLRDSSVTHIICPALDADTSLRTLAPRQWEEVAGAIIRARERLKVTEVAGVDQAVRAMFSDEAIGLAAIRSDFLEERLGASVCSLGGTPVQEAAKFLADGNELRLWRSLEAHVMAGNTAGVRRLLTAWIDWQARHRKYPSDFGRRFSQAVHSVPRHIRDKLRYPLPTAKQFCDLWQLASPEAYQDLQYLLEATFRRTARDFRAGDKPAAQSRAPASTTGASAVVEGVLESTTAEALARDVELPIDAARAAYVLESLVADSAEAVLDEATAFFHFLLSRTESVPASTDDEQVSKEALPAHAPPSR